MVTVSVLVTCYLHDVSNVSNVSAASAVFMKGPHPHSISGVPPLHSFARESDASPSTLAIVIYAVARLVGKELTCSSMGNFLNEKLALCVKQLVVGRAQT